MAIIWFIFIIFPCHCAVYMYKITILQKPLSQFPPNFTLILLLKFRNHLAEFHQISHWSFCWNVFDSLFKWSCSIDCQAHIFFFKTKNCSNDDIFISCDDRTGKMLHNICMSAVAMSLRWANCGPWASCLFWSTRFVGPRFDKWIPKPCTSWSDVAYNGVWSGYNWLLLFFFFVDCRNTRV